MVSRVGLEPTTPSLRGSCSNQLSYRPGRKDKEKEFLFRRSDLLTLVIISQKASFYNMLLFWLPISTSSKRCFCLAEEYLD